MISVVMPTTESRRHFWDGAIKCFLNQTYKNSELLIVEEATEPANRVFPDRVNYLLLPEGPKLSTGAKRNAANQYALGGILCHFDDDDWSHPLRLEQQIKFLEESGKSVVGFHDLLFFRTTDKTLWQYRFQGKPPYASGTTQMYRRSWWDKHRFKDMNVSEDSEMCFEASKAGELASVSGGKLIVARTHPQNTFRSNLDVAPFLTADRSLFPEEFLAEENL